MEKPRRPKKPQLEKPKIPNSLERNFYYPIEEYDTKEITIYTDEDLPTNPEDDYEAEENEETNYFWDSHGYAEPLPLSAIVAFAENEGIPLEELAIATLERSRDYCTSIQINHVRKVPDEEHALKLQAYEAEKTACKGRYQATLAQWQLDKEQYKIDKAAYDVYKAQQKLNSLQS